MNGQLNRLEQLEARFERLRILVQQMQAQLLQALQQIRDTQTAICGSFPGSACIVWSIPPVVIASGGSATGQTVSALSGGVLTTVTTAGTVYNSSGAPTSATAGEIYCGGTGDGTVRAIAQACA